jgi:hypothetical protein
MSSGGYGQATASYLEPGDPVARNTRND